MSSLIWTRCAGKSRLTFLQLAAFRVVEDQYKIITRRLVDSAGEQERLEQLIESVKPPVPMGPAWTRLNYLLSTPFRYPPLAHGSRFGTRRERGIWYGSETVDTALAEVAFWRLRFLNRTAAVIISEAGFTSFSVRLRSSHAVDLTARPFRNYQDRISSATSYADSPALGTDMRNDGVEFCRYFSARDPKKGLNLAVFSLLPFLRRSMCPTAPKNIGTHDRARRKWNFAAVRSRRKKHFAFPARCSK